MHTKSKVIPLLKFLFFYSIIAMLSLLSVFYNQLVES